MRILRASEDYLETMLMMQRKHGYIRSIDIASYLGVTKPSVSYATKRLRENGYITMDADGLISLTDSGLSIAEKKISGGWAALLCRPARCRFTACRTLRTFRLGQCLLHG